MVIRTMDMGGDKESSCFQLPKGESFLGAPRYSAIPKRSLHPEDPIEGYSQGGVYGHALIMYPMVSRIQEVWDANQILSEVKANWIGRASPTIVSLRLGSWWKRHRLP